MDGGMFLINEAWIKQELGTLYGESVVKDINRINELYGIYEGPGQMWPNAAGLNYVPTKTITNYIKKLIKAETRFMMSRAPEIKYVPADKAKEKDGDVLNAFLTGVLDASYWQRKLIQAGRDCFIGKRVCLKLSGGPGKPLRADFRPAQEFVFDTSDDDTTTLTKIMFFYQVAGEKDETDKTKQRIWCQRYEMKAGHCIMDEGLFDGNGSPVGENNIVGQDTGLDFIPCFVIINDGLTGDLRGESDVETLIFNQADYNHVNSDDRDALRFNLFPMRVLIDASEESASALKVAPGALADIATDTSGANDSKQAKFDIAESTFSYDTRIEHRLDRSKNDMYDLLSVPNVTQEMSKALPQSGKAMRSLYWELLSRCDEKWAEGWDDALRWMAESLIKMARQYNAAQLPEIDHTVQIDHLYPIPDDEEDERTNDITEVKAQVRSRQSYIDKWQPNVDKDGELLQIAKEQRLLEDAYTGAIAGELKPTGTEASGPTPPEPPAAEG